MVKSNYFFQEGHEQRYKEYTKKANVYSGDVEREALFYLMSSNMLYKKFSLENFYDCKDCSIKLDFRYDFMSSGERHFIELGYTLYNYNNKIDITDLFACLDEENFEIAINAIRIRFKR